MPWKILKKFQRQSLNTNNTILLEFERKAKFFKSSPCSINCQVTEKKIECQHKFKRREFFESSPDLEKGLYGSGFSPEKEFCFKTNLVQGSCRRASHPQGRRFSRCQTENEHFLTSTVHGKTSIRSKTFLYTIINKYNKSLHLDWRKGFNESLPIQT